MWRLPPLALGITALLSSCGQIGLGTATPNDPIPTGTVVAQGNFQGLNGKTVSGVVSVYRDCLTSCTFTIRLQGISVPNESSLLVVPTINGSAALSPSQYYLRASTGTQNYVFTGAASSTSFTQVAIHPSSAVAGTGDYGVATLQAVP